MTGSIGWHHIPGRSPLLGGWSLGVSSRSSQKQEALSFLQWTCDEQIANYFALLGGQTAITSAYTNDELVKLYPWLPLYHATYQYTKPTLPPEFPDHTVLFQNDIDAVVCRWVYELLDDKLQVVTPAVSAEDSWTGTPVPPAPSGRCPADNPGE